MDLVTIKNNLPLMILFQYSEDAIVILDQNACLLLYNEPAESFLQLNHEQDTGQSWQRLTERARIKAPRISKDSRAGICKSQGYKWIVKKLLDNDGNVDGFLCIIKHRMIDNIQAFSSEQALQISWLSNLIANLPGTVYWKDRVGRYLGCNKAVLTLSGFRSTRDLIGKTDYELPWKEHADEFRKLDNLTLETLKEQSWEETVQTPEGNTLQLYSVRLPLFNEAGEAIGTLGVTTDITKLKNQTPKPDPIREPIPTELTNKTTTEFLSNIIHDLRAPLNAVVGFSELLRETTDFSTEKCSQYTNAIYDSAIFLSNLIDNISSYTCIQEKKLAYHASTVELKSCIYRITNIFGINARKKNLEFSLLYDEKLPRYILIDVDWLNRIIINLISNAIKFTEEGYIRLLIESSLTEDRHPSLKITVQDSGIGISEDKQHIIFERFQREEPSFSPQKGFGLGLSIVKSLTEAMNGTISIHSKKHQGSTFTVILPLIAAKNRETTTISIESMKEALLKQRIHALVIEDDKASQKLMEVFLKRLGCQVVLASTGQEALRQLTHTPKLSETEQPFDIIFTDIGLSDIHGIDLLKKMRYLTDDQIPVVTVSAHVSIEDQQSFLEAGALIALPKPIIQEALIKTLYDILITEKYKELAH